MRPCLPFLLLSSLLWPTASSAALVADAAVWPIAGNKTTGLLYADLTDGELDQHELWEAALIAAGDAGPGELHYWRRQVAALCREVSRPGPGTPELPQPAVRLFQQMHRQFLTGPYREDCWRLRASLAGGPHNCLTSTILYLSLCRRLDIPATAVAESAHVFCRLAAEPGGDVQTTCADWFEHPAGAHRSRAGGAPPSSGTAAREISDVQLLAKVFYNRAVRLLAHNRFPLAVAQLQWACRLDPQDHLARQNLLAAYNNWALHLCAERRFAEAAERIAAGLAVAPNHDDLLANDRYVHQQWALQLCGANRFAEAVELLEQCYHRRPEVDFFDRGRWSIYRAWARWLVAEDQLDEARRVLSAARRRYPDARPLLDCASELFGPVYAGSAGVAGPTGPGRGT